MYIELLPITGVRFIGIALVWTIYRNNPGIAFFLWKLSVGIYFGKRPLVLYPENGPE
jgi:hypothetical protein